MADRHRADAYAREHGQRFVRELCEFVRFASVSADPRRREDTRRCAEWLAEHLRSIGLGQATVVPTAGNPVVVAERRSGGRAPTVLVYGHYDVQPADPAGWRSPPFEPTIRGENLIGRGASDDKGQLFVHVKAFESWLRATGGLPADVVCVFEGEEESGSTHLESFLRRFRRRLRADVAVVSDTPMQGPGRPVLSYALRGALNLELTVRTAADDLHSGLYGGAVANALEIACSLVAGLHDRDGRAAVRGFYDRVLPVSAGERAELARSAPTDAALLRRARALPRSPEPGYTLPEQATIRPALVVTGLKGGYAGPGLKAVVPARATAKIGIRLVPDQDPDEIARLVHEHVAARVPPGVQASVTPLSGTRPVVVDRRHPAVRAAARAYREGFGVLPGFERCGGTIPVVEMLRRVLGIPTVLMGFALPDDRMHGANEKLHLPTFFNGIATSIAFLDELARLPRAQPAPARSAT